MNKQKNRPHVKTKASVVHQLLYCDLAQEACLTHGNRNSKKPSYLYDAFRGLAGIDVVILFLKVCDAPGSRFHLLGKLTKWCFFSLSIGLFIYLFLFDRERGSETEKK